MILKAPCILHCYFPPPGAVRTCINCYTHALDAVHGCELPWVMSFGICLLTVGSGSELVLEFPPRQQELVSLPCLRGGRDRPSPQELLLENTAV